MNTSNQNFICLLPPLKWSKETPPKLIQLPQSEGYTDDKGASEYVEAANKQFHKEYIEAFAAYKESMILVENPEEAKRIWESQNTFVPRTGVIYPIDCEAAIKCNADCPDHQYGNCCHPSNCQKRVTLSAPLKRETYRPTVEEAQKYFGPEVTKWFTKPDEGEQKLTDQEIKDYFPELLPKIGIKEGVVEQDKGQEPTWDVKFIHHNYGDDIVITQWFENNYPSGYIGEIKDAHIIVETTSFDDCIKQLFRSCQAIIKYNKVKEVSKQEEPASQEDNWLSYDLTARDLGSDLARKEFILTRKS